MDYKQIKQKADIIAAKPVKEIKKDKLEKIIAEFTGKTPKSAQMNRHAGNILPGGSEHTLPVPFPYPLFMDKGEGAYLKDVDANRYIDYILSGGAVLLGHNYPEFVKNMIDFQEKHTHFHGFFDEMELKAGEKIINNIPTAEKIRFTSSGAEADMAAVRIARSYTGKKRIIKFQGGYHGWLDPFMTDMEVPGSGRYIAHGIPSEFLDLTEVVVPNDLEALEKVFLKYRNNDGIAAVICEPLGGESGLIPFEEGFHINAMNIAHSHGALYIFDEVVTGFRTGLGGAQSLLGINPDLTTLGKALMNGYPSCGAVCGKKEIMETLSTGLPGVTPYAYVAGTLSGNPLSAAAAYYSITELEKPGVMDHLFSVAEDYVRRLNDLFSAYSSDFFAYNYGGIIRIELTAPHAINIDSPEKMEEIIKRRSILALYSLVLENEGILSRMGRDMISCSHTVEDNIKAVKAYEKLVDLLD